MRQLGSLKYTYLAYLSQPAADRAIYRELNQRPVQSIVELGVGLGVRAQRMLAVAQRHQPEVPIWYTGIDLFEDRPTPESGIGLKSAYKLLREHHARVKLIPGDPFDALARISNTMMGVDLVVIDADQDAESLSRAWIFLPRMIHDTTRVFLQREPDAPFSQLTKPDVEELASWRHHRRRMAA